MSGCAQVASGRVRERGIFKTRKPRSISPRSHLSLILSSVTAIFIILELYKKSPPSQAEIFYLKSSTLDLSRTKATGANVYGLIRAVNHSLNSADIGLPGSVGLTVGVGNVMTEGHALTANTTLSHFDTS